MPPQGHMTEDHTLVVTLHTTNSQKSLIKKSLWSGFNKFLLHVSIFVVYYCCSLGSFWLRFSLIWKNKSKLFLFSFVSKLDYGNSSETLENIIITI